MSVIDQICFEQQKMRMARVDNEGWCVEKLNIIEQQYRNFMMLWKKYPDQDLPPSENVDIFWHSHILDTRKYHADCESFYGYYKHHFPYFGIRGDEDRKNLEKAFDQTLALYQKEFGEPLYDVVEK